MRGFFKKEILMNLARDSAIKNEKKSIFRKRKTEFKNAFSIINREKVTN